MNVVDRAPGLVDRLAASHALVADVEYGATEGIECFVEARTVVTNESSVHVLTHEEAFELKEKLVEVGGGCMDGVQHRVDGRRPGKALRLTDRPLQRADCALQLVGELFGLVTGLDVTTRLGVVEGHECTPEGADPL
ncbi:hypothetical protein LUW74_22675 [Actinomadura madurae]|uniref:hypothetical protein n=1 Tax=Actinomadura madurae TaxID=1993 RepID=UPI0020269954|nr:hypothetical protein [Actinomadura madurae]URN05834.1 hypothetical protein LUW74_22675 [Actinomadura madurae]